MMRILTIAAALTLSLNVSAADKAANKGEPAKPAAGKGALGVSVPAAPTEGYQDPAQFKDDYKAPKTTKDPKHTPKIDAPDTIEMGKWFPVTISIGAEGRHPSLLEHAVQWISLQKNGVEIARAYLHPVYATPVVTFNIALDETSVLTAVEAPNHTAQWTSEPKTITVTPRK